MDGSDNPRGQTSVLSVIGAPIEDGAGVPGTIMGPAALRTAGLIRTLRDLGYEVDDRGDLRLPDGTPQPVSIAGSLRNLANVAGWSRLLCRETHAAAKSGRLPIVIGGDHSLSIGSVSGIARHCAEVGRELFVLWLDAHADFNTPATSPSGNLHGMSAAWLCGEPGLPLADDAPRETLDPKNLHLFGVRAIDRGERDLLHVRGVDVVDMRRLDEFGASVLMSPTEVPPGRFATIRDPQGAVFSVIALRQQEPDAESRPKSAHELDPELDPEQHPHNLQ